MESEFCVCGDTPERHDEKGCLRNGCSCLGYRPAKDAAEPLPTTRFSLTGKKNVCHDFIRQDGLTVQCKAPIDSDGQCTNETAEHITIG